MSNHGSRKPLYKEHSAAARKAWTKHYWLDQVSKVARKVCNSRTTIESEDLEQEIWLAVCEGRMKMEELHSKAVKTIGDDCRHLILRSRQQRYAPFDVPDAEISAAMKDWHRLELQQRSAFLEFYKAYEPPTQIEDVWEGQVRQKHMELAHLGLSIDEVADLLEAPISGDRTERTPKL